MKRLLASSLILLAPTVLLAQAVSTANAPAPKAVAAKTATTKKPVSASRAELHSATSQVAAGIRAADAALTPGELAIAEQVHTGSMPCELGATVVIEADGKAPGYFSLRGKGFSYRVHPVETSTGAIRLEDQHAGAVWLQLSNKSMLMDQKAGKRLADECATPAQVAVAEALRKNPAPNLLEKPVVVK
jgi:hypothetical protein